LADRPAFCPFSLTTPPTTVQTLAEATGQVMLAAGGMDVPPLDPPEEPEEELDDEELDELLDEELEDEDELELLLDDELEELLDADTSVPMIA